MPSGHAYGKTLRTVKTCVGSEWCRFGTQDSTRMGKELERALWRMYAPHKVKLAVSGCPRNCAESGIKDVGVIGVDSGWEIYVAGNGGIKTDVAQFLCKVATHEEVLEVSAAFLQLYREEGWYLERTVHYVGRVGLDHVKAKVLEDAREPQAPRRAAALLARRPARPLVRARQGARRRAPVRADRGLRMDGHERMEDHLPRRRHPAPRRAQGHAPERRRHRRLPHRRRQGVRPARPVPAQGRAAVAGHRLRRERRLPAAQLDHRPGRRLRRRARRRLRPALQRCGSRTAASRSTWPSWRDVALARSAGGRGSPIVPLPLAGEG